MTRALLAATLLFFAGSAYAADMPLKAPPAAPRRLRPGPAGISASTAVADGAESVRTLRTLGLIRFSLVRTSRRWSRARPGASMSRADWPAAKSGYLYQAAPGQAIVGLDFAFDWSGIKGTANSGFTLTPSRHPPDSAGIWPPNRSHSSPQPDVSAPTWERGFPTSRQAPLLPSDLQRDLHRYLLSIHFI